MTFGCQMNKNDSERLATLLNGLSMTESPTVEAADIIIMNSCSVRERAEHRMYGLARRFAEMKKTKPELLLCITGCMPGRDKDQAMRKKLPMVDFFFPTKDMTQLPTWLAQVRPELRPMEDLDKDYLSLRPSIKKKYQAFITIQTGCNHFCSYCVVPFSRGLEQNRSLHDILAEARALAEQGCVEITLLGQIVNHYIAPDPQYFSPNNPYTKSHFAKLLWEMNHIPGIERVHFTAPHPIFMTEEVIDALTLPKQLNYLHLPVQSGNNDVLRRMNRRHTREFYIDLIKKIRAKKPDIAIGTDIIVGFCGETEEQFQDTIELYTQCDFDISYTAQYSSRTGTLAVKIFEDDVSIEEKKKRWWTLQQQMEQTVLRKNQQYLNTTVSVLVEECHAGWCTGNSREMKRIKFKGDASLIGKIVLVDIYKISEWVLWGRKSL